MFSTEEEIRNNCFLPESKSVFMANSSCKCKQGDKVSDP